MNDSSLNVPTRSYVPADMVVPAVVAVGLIGLSRVSFLWFHALAEIFSVVVGVSLYLVASRSYVFTRNNFLLFLAQGFFWAACVDLVHTLAYSGMGLISNNDPNPATQLWLLARGLETATLLLAPRQLATTLPPRRGFLLMGTAALGGMALIFAGLAPAAYVAGHGLTAFKVAAEYVIVSLLVVAGMRLYRHRRDMDADLYRIMLGVVAFTVVAELAFTVYVGVYDISNLVGHILKFWAFWLLLLAIIRWMLSRPFRLLSRQAHSFDHMPMPVLLLDAAGVVQSCNAAAREVRPDGGIGRMLHEAWHPAGAACPICHALAAGRDCEAELYDAATGRWTAARLHPIRRNGGPAGFVYVHSDITVARQVQERLMQSEKMEAIGQLTGGLAHDFNNLLGVVLGGLNLLAARAGDDEKTQRHLDITRRAAQRAVEVTRSLLAVARKQSLEPRDIGIETALADILPLLRQSIGKEVAIEDAIDPTCALELVHVDPTGLGNALLNLAINARDAMPDGGRLKIEVRAQTIVADQPGVAPELTPGRYIVVSVSDTGTGMPPEVAARAFDPFFTTKERGRGTGLGLAMVHGFARQSGGTATIYTEPGAGTTVRLYLPAVAGAMATAPTAADKAIGRGKGERILAVDDEADMLAVAGEWLNELGYRVQRADNPRQALELLAAQPPDLLFTDLMMPGEMDGLALAREARARLPGLRVLYASGYAGDLREAARPLLPKPYNRDELAAAVRRLLDTPSETAQEPGV